MAIGSFKQTTKEKVADLKETARIDEHLIKHYENILAHFDKLDAELVDQIAVIQAERDILFAKFTEAPEKLIDLNKHLKEIRQKIGKVQDNASGKTKRLNRIKTLRQRLSEMEGEFKADGADLEDLLNKLNEEEETE